MRLKLSPPAWLALVGALTASILLAAAPTPAVAQNTFKVVTSCPATLGVPYTVGQFGYPTMDVNGNSCGSGSGGGGGGGAVTAAAGSYVDGSIVTLGFLGDVYAPSHAGSYSANARLAGIQFDLETVIANQGNATTVNQGTSPWVVQQSAGTSGGGLTYHVQTAATTNAALVSTAAAHTAYYLHVTNPTTSMVCVHLYDSGSSPTVGTTTIKHTYTIGAAATATQGGGGIFTFGPFGDAYTSGIAVAATGGASNTCTDADTSNAPLGVSVEIGFK